MGATSANTTANAAANAAANPADSVISDTAEDYGYPALTILASAGDVTKEQIEAITSTGAVLLDYVAVEDPDSA